MAMLPSVRPGKQTVWLAATGKKKAPQRGGFFYESIRQRKEKRRHAANRQLRFGTHKNSSVRHVPSRQIVRNYTRRRGEFKQKNAVFSRRAIGCGYLFHRKKKRIVRITFLPSLAGGPMPTGV
ncbi:hypothetical protein HLB25_18395 [Dickeya dadantii]|uniref:hypothetical protein n=1 Tax=Dickeya dadantii TaxID=204038 RepID=UPI0014959C4B|nr:hypothetical protein [Dickeya dadantii]NPE68555.1 hypothetical protein [Dickeya dadantii]